MLFNNTFTALPDTAFMVYVGDSELGGNSETVGVSEMGGDSEFGNWVFSDTIAMVVWGVVILSYLSEEQWFSE